MKVFLMVVPVVSALPVGDDMIWDCSSTVWSPWTPTRPRLRGDGYLLKDSQTKDENINSLP